MPKLPFKRKAVDDGGSLQSYIPSQMVDYTSLPPIEEDTARTRFNRLPLVARIGTVVLPVLLLVGVVWGLWQYMFAAPIQAEAPPQAAIKISEARVVSADAINVEAQVSNAPVGTMISAQLLANGQPTTWGDVQKSTKPVQNGKVSVRLSKAATASVLSAEAAYVVELKLSGTDVVTAQFALEISDKLKADFLGKVEPTATPEPTVQPTQQPTLEPTPVPEAGPPSLTVSLDTTMLISPTLGTQSVAKVQLGTKFEPLFRSADNKWFLVQQGNQVGWLHADHAKLDPAAVEKVALVTPKPEAVAAGSNKAVVFNGGNIRYQPDMKRGTVLGQLHAGQKVTLAAKTADGQWFKVVAPEAEGWVSVSLLTIDPKVAVKVAAQ